MASMDRKGLAAVGVALWLLMRAVGASAQSLWADPAFALYQQAAEAFNRKEYDRAADLAREAIGHYPEHLLAYYLLGQAALAGSNWDEAARAFSKVVRLYPRSFAGHRELGLALVQVKRLDEAAAALEAALRLRPDAEEIQVRLAFLSLQAGKQDRAFALLKGLADRGTREPEVWYALGRLYYDRDDFTASERAFNQAVALRDEGNTWFNLGVVRMRLEDHEGALKAFERAARDPDLREQASRELERIREYRKALEPPRPGMERPRTR